MINEVAKRISATIRPIFASLRRAADGPFVGMSVSVKRLRHSNVCRSARSLSSNPRSGPCISRSARPARSISRHPLSAHFHHVRKSKYQNHIVQPQFSLYPNFGQWHPTTRRIGLPTDVVEAKADLHPTGATKSYSSEKLVRIFPFCRCQIGANAITSLKPTRLFIWWSQGESNPRPLECHSSALPTELWPLLGSGIGYQVSVIRCW
jgi:hypothetical protein